MVKIERFEDIEAWKKAREIAQQVYSVTCSGDFARDFGLRDQVQRAAVSIMIIWSYHQLQEPDQRIYPLLTFSS